MYVQVYHSKWSSDEDGNTSGIEILKKQIRELPRPSNIVGPTYVKKKEKLNKGKTGHNHDVRSDPSGKKTLKNAQGSWSMDRGELENLALQFYKNLYIKDSSTIPNPHSWNFPKLNRSSIQWINRPMVEVEIKKAVFHMGANKAPGPDGIPTNFFRDTGTRLGVQ